MKLCDNTPSQKFTYFYPFINDQRAGMIRSTLSDKCLDVKDAINKSGQKVQLWGCDNTKWNHFWSYDPTTKKISAFTSNNMVLDINRSSGLDVNNATIMINNPATPSTSTQKWAGSNNCTLSPTPSDLSFSPCDATQCGTTGKRQRRKYNVSTSSAGLGSCPNEFDIESTPCSADPCQDCTLSPSNADWGECNASECGATGERRRRKYKVDSVHKYGGKCPNEFEMESTPCSADPCPVNCTLSSSNSDWGACSASECGTTGTRQRQKYKVDSPSMYGGSCPSEFEMESTPCSAVPCPVNCTLSPSKAVFSPCSSTQCGTTGKQTRHMYIVKKPSMNGGSCLGQDDVETIECKNAPCAAEIKSESFMEKNKFYLIGGGVGFVVLIVLILIIKK
jgi:hypothetical protein